MYSQRQQCGLHRYPIKVFEIYLKKEQNLSKSKSEKVWKVKLRNSTPLPALAEAEHTLCRQFSANRAYKLLTACDACDGWAGWSRRAGGGVGVGRQLDKQHTQHTYINTQTHTYTLQQIANENATLTKAATTKNRRRKTTRQITTSTCLLSLPRVFPFYYSMHLYALYICVEGILDRE